MLESSLLFYKNYYECFLLLSFILTPCLRSHTPVKILLNVWWQHEAELGRVPCWKKKKKAKAENPIEWFFFHFFNLSIFVSLEMFTIHQKFFYNCIIKWASMKFRTGSYKKDGMDLSKSGREYGSQSLLRFCVSRIYFSNIYINAKYK